MSWRAEDAQPIVKSVSKKTADPRGGLFAVTMKGKAAVVAYEPDKALSDTEIVAFGGRRDRSVLRARGAAPRQTPGSTGKRPRSATKFRSHGIYKPKPPRPLAEIKAEIDALECQAQALLDAVLVEADA